MGSRSMAKSSSGRLRAVLALLVVSSLLLAFSAAFGQQTTYTFHSQAFEAVSGSYVIEQNVTGSITLSEPLAPNTSMNVNSILVAYSFSDGVVMLDDTNSEIISGIHLATDAAGGIQSYGMTLWALPLATAVGEVFTGMDLVFSPGLGAPGCTPSATCGYANVQIYSGDRECWSVAGGVCVSAILGTTDNWGEISRTADETGFDPDFDGSSWTASPSQMAINAGDSQSATAGTAVPDAPSVLVTDANDNPVEDVEVTFAVASGGGSVTGAIAMTNASGIATVGSWTLGATAGENTLTADAAGLTQVTFTATGTTVPAAPTDVSATAGNTEATVTWTPPSDDGGMAITSYTVTGKPGGSCSVAGTVTECTITGLTNGTEYIFLVMATNAAGDGPSSPSNTVTPATVPAAPMNVTATAGNAEATVTWTPPPDDGGSPIIGYTVTGDPGGSCSVDGDVTECTITGLTNGTEYSFTVIATNAQGDSLPSASSNAVTPVSVPAAPTDVSATPGNAEVTVSWTPPTDTGGSPITGYTVTGDPGGSCSVAGDVSECTITGLTNGTEYTFTVVATNDEGNSLPSLASASVIPIGPPNGVLQAQVEPTILGLVVSWVAPSDNGGTPMLSYRADANPSCEVTALANEVPGQTAYSCTIGNLDPGQDYTVTVTAINAVGESTVVAGAGAIQLPAPIPVPTLGAWALLSLMLLMLVVAQQALLRKEGF
jgi:hypothetical protein